MFRLSLFAPLILYFIGCAPEGDPKSTTLTEINGQALGTTWTVKVIASHFSEAEELKRSIQEELERNEMIFSHWRRDSLLSNFNSTLDTKPHPIHPQIHEILAHGQWMHGQTGGAFDPTVGSLVNLWGFGPLGGTRSTIPSDESIARTLERTGMERLELFPEVMIRKKNPALQLDLSGSAKGEIIDQICRLLDRWDLKNHLVEIGGEIRARGQGRRGMGWKVGLEDGRGSNVKKAVSIHLRDWAVATSGTYRQNKPIPGSNRYASHLIDPRTGRPVEHDLVAVNAFAPTARDADAWATALMVLGPKEGMQVAEDLDMAVRFCLLGEQRMEVRHSTAYQRLFHSTNR